MRTTKKNLHGFSIRILPLFFIVRIQKNAVGGD